VRLDATGLASPDVLADRALQACPCGQPQDRRQVGARHEVRVVEHGRDAATDSDLAGALSRAVK